jgi:hypothetical protein
MVRNQGGRISDPRPQSRPRAVDSPSRDRYPMVERYSYHIIKSGPIIHASTAHAFSSILQSNTAAHREYAAAPMAGNGPIRSPVTKLSPEFGFT